MYLVELTLSVNSTRYICLPYDIIVLGATYNAGVASTYCDEIRKGQAGPLKKEAI